MLVLDPLLYSTVKHSERKFNFRLFRLPSVTSLQLNVLQIQIYAELYLGPFLQFYGVIFCYYTGMNSIKCTNLRFSVYTLKYSQHQCM